MLRELNISEMEYVSGGTDEVISEGVLTGGNAWPTDLGYLLADMNQQNNFALGQAINSMYRSFNELGISGTDSVALDSPECNAARAELKRLNQDQLESAVDGMADYAWEGTSPLNGADIVEGILNELILRGARNRVDQHC